MSLVEFCNVSFSDLVLFLVKVLGNYQSKKHPRKSSSKAVKLNLEAVRPDPSIHIEENRCAICFNFSILAIFLHLKKLCCCFKTSD